MVGAGGVELGDDGRITVRGECSWTDSWSISLGKDDPAVESGSGWQQTRTLTGFAIWMLVEQQATQCAGSRTHLPYAICGVPAHSEWEQIPLHRHFTPSEWRVNLDDYWDRQLLARDDAYVIVDTPKSNPRSYTTANFAFLTRAAYEELPEQWRALLDAHPHHWCVHDHERGAPRD